MDVVDIAVDVAVVPDVVYALVVVCFVVVVLTVE